MKQHRRDPAQEPSNQKARVLHRLHLVAVLRRHLQLLELLLGEGGVDFELVLLLVEAALPAHHLEAAEEVGFRLITIEFELVVVEFPSGFEQLLDLLG